MMAMTDPEPSRRGAARAMGPSVTLERLGARRGGGSHDDARPTSSRCSATRSMSRRPVGRASTAETAASLANAAFTHYLARIDGEPRRGRTAGDLRWRELSLLDRDGRLGPRARARARWSRWPRPRTRWRRAASGSISVSSPTTQVAIRLYHKAGFEMVGAPAPDLLLLG